MASEARSHTKDKHAEKVLEQRTVVVKGVGKHVAMSAICAHLEQAGSIAEVTRVRSTAFVSFTTPRQATWAVDRLNNLELQSQPLQVFLLGGPGWSGPCTPGPGVHEEVGVESSGQHSPRLRLRNNGDYTSTGPKEEVPGPVQKEFIPMETEICALSNRLKAKYAHKAGSSPSRFQVSSISSKRRAAHSTDAEDDDAPTFGAGFTGLYLVRLLRLWRQKRENAAALPLLRIVTAQRSKQTKEVCESMGVVQALFDFGNAHKLELMQMKALVFVPGDGNRPNTAAALCLQVPDSWRIYSVDPALHKFETSTLGAAASRLHVVPTMLEDFAVPAERGFDICIVLAVHCHAPLIEFWARLPQSMPAVCVSLPCCGDHGWLSSEPQAITKDPEIPSQKNTLFIYYRPPAPPL